ncbi:hypothetical protein BN159_6004 [Streptomyces davaonensis JCM 4913]|uniref:Transposase IS30-like HTH domain-containing protein n=1 Tax=Streptomyces davaonensis (strain DSM 101723 / JCM 4913 / KCC S-0913 / 768) TaxID=1214101 RepID=K4RAI3_STRDJ|nr:hypothetical protein [Streptomyces davaonensis]CCK30383.1 hypothetical protein BN159_6004 [Streptomyces davaonensis JCM 4913]
MVSGWTKTPVTEEDYQRVRELHALGMGRNAIAREINRAQRTVSVIAAELGLTFGTSTTAARWQWLASVAHPQTSVLGVWPEFTVVDPSAASYIEQLHRDGVSGVTPAENTVADGIRTVASLLAGDRLRVHPSARGLIEELPGDSWDDEAAGKARSTTTPATRCGTASARQRPCGDRTSRCPWRWPPDRGGKEPGPYQKPLPFSPLPPMKPLPVPA